MKLDKKPKRQKGRHKFNSYRTLVAADLQILQFLWTWKVATSNTIHALCAPEGTSNATFKRLQRLEKFGRIQSIKHPLYNFWYWELTPLGFEVIKSDQELEEEGYRSENPWHDLNVMAFQLGDWPLFKIPRVEIYSEQNLRRLSEQDYPDWVPRIKGRRPDGYTKVTGPERKEIIAIEVELSEKSHLRYESIIRFYRTTQKINRVYWLIATPKIRSQIQQAMVQTKEPKDNYHLFVDLKTYMKVGWDTPVFNWQSQPLFTMREHYLGNARANPGQCQGNGQAPSLVPKYYAPQKVIGRSTAYKKTEIQACP